MKTINILKSTRGEGHIDTGIKIIIAVVIGALILGGLYALFATVILPNLSDEVDAMMEHGENGAVVQRVAAVTRVVDYVKKDAPYPLYKMKEVSCVATPKNIKRFQIASGIATFVLDNTGKNNAKDDLEWIDQIEMWDALMN